MSTTPPIDRCPDCGCVTYYGLLVGLHTDGCPQARYEWPTPDEVLQEIEAREATRKDPDHD